MRDRSGAGLLPVGWPCSAFMTLAANLHRWRLSSSLSPFSPLLSGSSHALRLGSLPDAAGIVCGSLRLAGSGLSALGLAMICGPWRSPLSVLPLLLALPAPLLLFSSSAPAALLLSCTACGALPLLCSMLRRAGAALLGCAPAVSGCRGGRCLVRHIAQISGLYFVYFFLPIVRLATYKIIDFCPDFW